MGSPKNEVGRWDNEGPQHEVTLTRGYWLGETPVTQSQWEAVMGENPSYFKGGDLPVEQVRWHDCLAFSKRLDERCPGLHAALPSEAQWEYACRAGQSTAFNDGSACTQPVGNDPALDKLGWFAENSEGKTHSLKKKKPNAWGLYDMHGNVWEWCLDGKRAYGEPSEIDPLGPMEESANRVVRGGSWRSLARYCRSAYRGRFGPGNRDQNLGFRLAAGQEPSAAEPLGAERP